MDYKLIEQLQKLNEDNQLFKPASNDDLEGRRINFEVGDKVIWTPPERFGLEKIKGVITSYVNPLASLEITIVGDEDKESYLVFPDELEKIVERKITEDNQLFKPNSNDDQNNRKEIELKELQRDWPIGTKVKSEDNKLGRVYKINPENEFGLTIIVKYIDPHSDDSYSLGSFSPDELVKI